MQIPDFPSVAADHFDRTIYLDDWGHMPKCQVAYHVNIFAVSFGRKSATKHCSIICSNGLRGTQMHSDSAWRSLEILRESEKSL